MSEPTYVQEHNAIVEVVNKYIEGGRKGSGAIMKPAFHEKATIFGLAGEELFGPEIEKLYAVNDQNGPSPEAQPRFARVDIVGTAANVRLDSENWAGSRFTDFLNLVKLDGKWIIVNKVYYAHPSA
jgi:hypothetical protein